MRTEPIIVEVNIHAELKTVWEAITYPEKMKVWYFEFNNFNLKVGNEFYFFEPGGNKKYRHQCKVTEIVPNHKFQHKWAFPDYSDGTSTLTWELTQQGDVTHVKLIHKGVETFADGGKDFARENFEVGWKEIVSKNLKNYLTNKRKL